MKWPVKRLAAFLLAGGILIFALNRAYVTPVLMYNHIDERSREWKLSVSSDSFARQMEFLKAHRYRVLSLGEYAALLRDKKRIPRKSVVITFDDGYDDVFSQAYPVLRKMGFPATVFVRTDSIRQPGHLTHEDLAIMSENGIEIGSHAVTHAFPPDMASAEIEKEFANSKTILEDIIEKPVTLLSYPGGGYSDAAAKIAENIGYEAAVTTSRKGRGPLDRYAIRRIRISRTADSLVVFWLKTSGFSTWFEEWKYDSDER